jgi:two-component system, sporulation sensor kinase E
MKQADLMQRLIDSANAAIYLKDEQGRFLLANRQIAEEYNVSKEEIIGKTDYDFVSKEDADTFRKYDLLVASAGLPMNFEITFSSADGQHTIIDHKFPVADIEGCPNAVGGIAIDVTTRK